MLFEEVSSVNVTLNVNTEGDTCEVSVHIFTAVFGADSGGTRALGFLCY